MPSGWQGLGGRMSCSQLEHGLVVGLQPSRRAHRAIHICSQAPSGLVTDILCQEEPLQWHLPLRVADLEQIRLLPPFLCDILLDVSLIWL